MTAPDARRAIEAGASAVYVSNHGGRQLDGALSTIEVLPAVVAEVAGQVPVLLDSGVRRGADAVKAIASGASAIVIGRLAAYGLAADGQAGVERVLDRMRLRTAGHRDPPGLANRFAGVDRRQASPAADAGIHSPLVSSSAVVEIVTP